MEDLPFFRIGGENLSKNRVNAMIVLTLIVGLAVGYSLSIALPYQLPPKKPAISLSVNPATTTQRRLPGSQPTLKSMAGR